MVQAFVITLREGLEAFLIVAISLAYLRKTGRTHLTSAVHWGIGIAVALSCGAGYLLFNAVEPGMARRAARASRGRVGHLDGRAHVARGPTDEGRHRGTTAVVERARRHDRVSRRAALHRADDQPRRNGDGAAADAAARDAGIWSTAPLPAQSAPRASRGSGRATAIASTSALFFQVTAIFLFVFVVQLVVRGVHEMSEQTCSRSVRSCTQDGSLGTRQPVRSPAHLSAGAAAVRLADAQVGVLHATDHGAEACPNAWRIAPSRTVRQRADLAALRSSSLPARGFACRIDRWPPSRQQSSI